MEYHQINLSIPVALTSATEAGRKRELEWIKNAIRMYVCDHPDEIFDKVSIIETLPLTEAEFNARDGDEPKEGYSEATKRKHWDNDPRGQE